MFLAERLYQRHVLMQRSTESLDQYMNNEMRAKIGIIPANVTWGGELSLD